MTTLVEKERKTSLSRAQLLEIANQKGIPVSSKEDTNVIWRKVDKKKEEQLGQTFPGEF